MDTDLISNLPQKYRQFLRYFLFIFYLEKLKMFRYIRKKFKLKKIVPEADSYMPPSVGIIIVSNWIGII